ILSNDFVERKFEFMEKHVFALDIGTQSITGILLEKNEKKYEIIDYCIRQHKERTMLDGQIQDVVEVAEMLKEVTAQLSTEQHLLTDVCVAAAGRALKTIQADNTVDISTQALTTEESLTFLELGAVQHALQTLTKEQTDQLTQYHCVGYSVLHYKLDGEPIGSLID